MRESSRGASTGRGRGSGRERQRSAEFVLCNQLITSDAVVVRPSLPTALPPLPLRRQTIYLVEMTFKLANSLSLPLHLSTQSPSVPLLLSPTPSLFHSPSSITNSSSLETIEKHSMCHSNQSKRQAKRGGDWQREGERVCLAKAVQFEGEDGTFTVPFMHLLFLFPVQDFRWLRKSNATTLSCSLSLPCHVSLSPLLSLTPSLSRTVLVN